MRSAHCLVPLLAASAAILAGCGYAGEPKPPALRRPLRATDLSAVERGSNIIVTFTLPDETTEGLTIESAPDIELRVGAAPAQWNLDAWRASSDRVPVIGWQSPRGATGAASRINLRKLKPGGAKVASGAKPASGAVAASGAVRRRATKKSAPAEAAVNKALLTRTVEIDASKYTGKATVIGVCVHGPKGRDDGWSTVTLNVLPVLPIPANLAATDAPGAVHLQWAAEAPAFRVFRREQGGTDWTQIGEATQASFDDKTFDYGKTWQYYVQSVRKAGDSQVESDPSATYTFTPKDRFPPAVPAGLTVIPGIKTVELSWDPVTDGDLAGYRVYRNGMRIADALMSAAYSDKDVMVGSKYSYQVSAVDQAGNESMKSAAQEITME